MKKILQTVFGIVAPLTVWCQLRSAEKLFLVNIPLLIGCVSLCCGGDTPYKTGRFRISFEQRSPYSSMKEMGKRTFNFDKNDDYDIKAMNYEVFVPENYNPATPMALFVWISPFNDGKCPGEWRGVWARHGFIFISAAQSGNDQPLLRRIGLPLDAAMNMPKLYNIDTNRIYISGNSGGGRCASRLGVMFPDVFTGGACYIVGCDFYGALTPGEKGFWGKPDPRLIQMARDRRFVFLTGSQDYNQPGTRVCFEAYQKAGFKNCQYIEVPGMGHITPPAAALEQGLVFLNKR